MPTSKLHPITPDDLYRLRIIDGCELSPDGEWLATTITCQDRSANKAFSHIWLIPTQRGEPLQFTFGDQHDSNPQFSPDGRLLAFLSDRSGTSQVRVARVSGGESRQLGQVAGTVCAFAWSPDGRKLCLTVFPSQTTADKPAPAPLVHHFTGYSCQPPGPHVELQLLDVKTGRSTPLVRDEYHNGEAAFTPDGQWVVFCSNKHPESEINPLRDDLWKVRTSGGKPKLIKTHGGPVYTPAVSPDGQWIAFRGFADPDSSWNQSNLDLYVVPAGGGAVRNLSGALDRTTKSMVLSDSFNIWQSGAPLWSPDSKSLYTIVTDGGQAKVYRFGLDGGPGEPVLSKPGAVLSFAIDFARQRIYSIDSDAMNPADLYTRPLPGGSLRRLTRVNAWLARRDLGRLTQLDCPAGGGPALQGWVLTPPDFSPRRKYPGILYIHGGPANAYGPVFMHEFQYLAGLGYAVFFCNPRGSLGYGADFLAAIHHDWGNLDYQDLLRFTDYVLKQCPFIDPARLGVTGGSYGGFMTNWIIGHTQRFKAAVSQRSISNLLSRIGSSAHGFGVARGLCAPGLTPWQAQAGLLQQSPLAHLEHARTPTLVVHSEQDQAAPVEQAQQLYVQLKLMGVETEFVRFPEEGHELSRSGRTDRRIERLKCISGWFDRYLKR
jgi:dipeptidyl aminopeptidase/acylaminoacyl peptidase